LGAPLRNIVFDLPQLESFLFQPPMEQASPFRSAVRSLLRSLMAMAGSSGVESRLAKKLAFGLALPMVMARQSASAKLSFSSDVSASVLVGQKVF
jgi:hypothetical protein